MTKILFISMPSIHFIRWVENLNDSNFELYWFDILNRGTLGLDKSVNQFTSWKKRKVKVLKGEYFIYKNFPKTYNYLKPFLEITENEQLETIIKKIKPDIIHSFEMQSCSYPILKTMNKYPNIKWIYSCWGSDLYYYRKLKKHNLIIHKVLKRVNFLITDCKRDYEIAKELNFKGKHLDVIPGGSGYKIENLNSFYTPVLDRKIILIKGYQHDFGRAIQVIKAIENCINSLLEYEIIIYSAHQSVINYVAQNKLKFTVYHRNQLTQIEVLKLMGKSLIAIGNSTSDGMPNTLLESIVMGAFPIQSNPGLVTEEIIQNNKNGIIINDPNNIEEIEKCILFAINNKEIILNAAQINKKIALNSLDYKIIKKKINQIYISISK